MLLTVASLKVWVLMQGYILFIPITQPPTFDLHFFIMEPRRVEAYYLKKMCYQAVFPVLYAIFSLFSSFRLDFSFFPAATSTPRPQSQYFHNINPCLIAYGKENGNLYTACYQRTAPGTDQTAGSPFSLVSFII